jgi:hypothetical protein
MIEKACSSQGKRRAFPGWLQNFDHFRLWWTNSPGNFAVGDDKAFTTYFLGLVMPMEALLMKQYCRPQMTLNLDCNKIAASHLHALSVVALKVAGIRLRRKSKTAQDLQQDDRCQSSPKGVHRRSDPAKLNLGARNPSLYCSRE